MANFYSRGKGEYIALTSCLFSAAVVINLRNEVCQGFP